MEAITIAEIVVIGIVVIAFITWLAWQIKKNGLRQTVIHFIVEAEDEFNKGENEAKINSVINKVIMLLPLPLQIFITDTMVRKFVQKIFDEVKKALDYKAE